MSEAHVIHAYGVIPAESSIAIPATGVDGAPVRLGSYEGIGVLLSDLDADRYGAQAWQRHGQDPGWLSGIAAQHQAVLDSVVAQGDVIPLRLPGIYSDEPALARAMAQSAPGFLAIFDSVRGHVEWGVKVFRCGADQSPPADASRPTSGRDYLRRRSEEAAARRDAVARLHRDVETLHESLVVAATRGVLNKPQDPALSGYAEPMLLNGAYLVRRDSSDVFLETVTRLGEGARRSGMALAVTGPWPPYNFASMESA